MLLSVTEGHDKPKKYPLMFRRAGLLVLNKVDLLPMCDFDVDVAVGAARDVHPAVDVIRTSCRTGEGIAEVGGVVRAAHRRQARPCLTGRLRSACGRARARCRGRGSAPSSTGSPAASASQDPSATRRSAS